MRNHPQRLVVTTVAAALLTLAACACASASTSVSAPGDGSAPGSPVLSVCSDIPYPPFELTGADGPTGFDIDLVTELGSRLGRTVEITPTPLDGFADAFARGTCDLAASALVIPGPGVSPWPFSVPYLAVDQSLLVRSSEASQLPSFSSLSGRRVGVVADSTSADFAATNLPTDATVVPFPSVDDAVGALRAGTVDAIVADGPVASSVASTDGAFTVTEARPTSVRYGLAIDPTDASLLSEVNTTLQAMDADGTLQRLSDPWFGG